MASWVSIESHIDQIGGCHRTVLPMVLRLYWLVSNGSQNWMKQSRRNHPGVSHRSVSSPNFGISVGVSINKEWFDVPGWSTGNVPNTKLKPQKHAAVRVKLRCHTLVFGIALVNVFLKPNSGLMISSSSSGSMKCPIPNNLPICPIITTTTSHVILLHKKHVADPSQKISTVSSFIALFL